MQQNEITVSRKNLHYAIGLVILAILLALAIKFPLFGSGHSPNAASIESSNLPAGSPEKFALLSGQGGERSVGST